MLQAIDHVVYYVTDVERTATWYEEYFDLTVEGLDDWRTGNKPFASIRVSPTLIIDLMTGTPAGQNVDHVAFTTTPEAFETFVKRHPELIEMGPSSLSGAQGIGQGIYLRDPDNHRLELRTYG